MRKLLFIFIIGFVQIVLFSIQASIPPADSLKNLLKGPLCAEDRVAAYVHLADLYADSTQIAPLYWDKALAEAIKTKDEYITKLALDMLVKRYAGKDSNKVNNYIAIAKQNLPEKHNALFCAYLYCYTTWAQMRKNNSLETVGHELNRLKSEDQNRMTPEMQIQWEFLTGVSLDYSSLLTHAYQEIPKAIPYLERADHVVCLPAERPDSFRRIMPF